MTYRARILVLGLGLPVLLATIGAALMASWAPELPDPIAIHWNGATPDGYGPLWGAIALLLGVTAAFGLFVVAATWKPQPSGRPSGTQKLLVSASNWMAAVLVTGIGGSISAQRGLGDASQTGGVLAWIALGAGVGVAFGVVAWFLLPKADNSSATAREVGPIGAAPSQRATWTRTVRIAAVAWMNIVGAGTVAIVAVVVLWIAQPRGVAYAAVALAAMVMLALFTTMWQVTADTRGLTVRSLLGWPRKHIPTDDIATVQVVQVNPSADFGGWGWRWAPGRRSGIIMRNGAAIEVTRRDGSRFVVTVDDAATGAGVLAGAIARRAPAPPAPRAVADQEHPA